MHTAALLSLSNCPKNVRTQKTLIAAFGFFFFGGSFCLANLQYYSSNAIGFWFTGWHATHLRSTPVLQEMRQVNGCLTSIRSKTHKLQRKESPEINSYNFAVLIFRHCDVLSAIFSSPESSIYTPFGSTKCRVPLNHVCAAQSTKNGTRLENIL